MATATQDLSSILSDAVETQNTTVNDFIPAPETASVDDLSDDFEEPEIDEEEPENEPDIPLTKEALKKAGKRWIGLVDHLQKPFLINAYNKAILKAGDLDKLAHYKKTRDLSSEKNIKDACNEDPELYGILKRFDEYSEACEKLAFSDEEKEMIAEPLAEVLEKYKNMHMSPEMALLVAVAMVMLPRVAPLFPNLFKGAKL